MLTEMAEREGWKEKEQSPLRDHDKELSEVLVWFLRGSSRVSGFSSP
jgi:hypothetical protein